MLIRNVFLFLSFRRRHVALTAVRALMIATATASIAPAQEVPATDPNAEIAAALAKAKLDGKYVMLDFGADWCPDCRVFWTLLKDTTVAAYAEKNFHIVGVDVGRRDKNMDVAARYGAPVPKWIPALAILDPNGTVTAISGDGVPRGPSRITTRATAADVASYLRLWSPKAKVASLHEFTENGARVEVLLEKDSDGQHWMAAVFSPLEKDSYVYGKDIPPDGVDGLGRPIRFAITSTIGAQPAGPAVADRVVQEKKAESLNLVIPSYPYGPVTLRFPITLPAASASTRTEIVIGYMVCGETTGCQAPVEKRITVEVPRAPK